MVQATRKRRVVKLAPPSLRRLRHWQRVCEYLDSQPFRSVAYPFPDDPPMSAILLKRMACFHLVHHRDDCRWRLSSRWREALRRLIANAEDDADVSLPDMASDVAPCLVVAGPDTEYVNLLADALPAPLLNACDDFKARAQAEDSTAETPWLWCDRPLSMYKAGKGTSGAGGVSWGYILRNEMVELKLRKRGLSGIVGQVRLSSKALWTYGAVGALDRMREGVQRLWDYHAKVGEREDYPGYQLSQIHLCADIAHFHPLPEDLHRVITHSRQKVGRVPSLDEETIPSAGEDLDDVWWEDEADDPFPFPLDDDDEDDPFDDEEDRDDAGDDLPDETDLAEEIGVEVQIWGKRATSITFSPRGDLSMIWYDKALEERRSLKKQWMIPIHKEHGWDGEAHLTRIEGRLRRPAIRDLRLAFSEGAATWIDDPWEAVKHYQDMWGYIVGLPPEADIPDVAYRGWLRLAVPSEDSNRGRWPTDPAWQVVQRATFSDAPPLPLKRMHEAVPDLLQLDAEVYGLLKTIAVLRGSYLHGAVTVKDELVAFDERIAQWMAIKGRIFSEDVREKARMLGKPLPLLPAGMLPLHVTRKGRGA